MSRKGGILVLLNKEEAMALARKEMMVQLQVRLKDLPDEKVAAILDFAGYLRAQRLQELEDGEDRLTIAEAEERWRTHPEEFLDWDEVEKELEKLDQEESTHALQS
jgi:hypothetical protein